MDTVMNGVALEPLTHPQKRISYVELRYPNSPIHVVGLVSMIEGNINFSLLEQSISLFIRQHEAFHLNFIECEGEIKQYVRRSEELTVIDFYDFSDKENADLVMQQWVEKEVRQAISITDDQLYKFTMFRLDSVRSGLLIKLHHIITDGWSVQLLTEGIGKLYMSLVGKSNHEQLERPGYLTVISQEEKYFSSSRCKRDNTFWMKQFNILPQPLFTNDDPNDIEGSRASFLLDKHKTAAIKQLAVSLDCSENTILTGLVLLYLHRSLKRNDLVIGTPIFNRYGQQEKEIFGIFTSNMPLRVQVESGETIANFLVRLKEIITSCYRHQKYPYDLLAQQLELRRSGREQLFQVTMNCFNTKMLTELNGWQVDHREIYNGNQLNALQFVVNDWNGKNELTVDVQYKISLFSEEDISNMILALENLLEQMIDNCNGRVSDLSLLSAEHITKILETFNRTMLEVPRNKLIHELLQEQTILTPHGTALVFKEKELSYNQLNKQSNRIAHQLRKRGVGSHSIVGILAERSLEMIVGIYGIMKAGGAYLPIDPTYPQERIDYVVKDSGAQIILIGPHLREKMVVSESDIDFMELTLNLESDGAVSSCNGDNIEHTELWENPSHVNNPQDLAYVIYTSGSTGKPKGVMIEHLSVINFIRAMQARIPIEENHSILCVTTMSFDIFVMETLVPLSSGMRVIIADELEQVDSEQLNQLIIEKDIDVLQMTPSRMRLLLAEGQRHQTLSHLKVIMLGGEPLPLTLLKQLREQSTARIFNMYGPTETTVWSTVQELTDKENITIGVPIANTSIYILDAHNELLPIGSSGQLCISGDGLARGYWNRPELTKEKFIEHPFVANERLYLTGDLAKWLPNGQIQHLGRIDDQVKIRGYRIELGEIESVLLQHPFIKMTAVRDWESNDGTHELAAYVTMTKSIKMIELRKYLGDKLPQYMIPSYFVELEQLPLTPNGKVDRKALPQPQESRKQKQHNENMTEQVLEKTISGCWSQIFSGHLIEVDDHFFEIGGHSLHVLKVVSLMKERGILVQASDLYKAPTAVTLADLLRQRHGDFEFTPWIEEDQVTSVASSISINHRIRTNVDAYGWEQVNCFTKPMAILFDSFQSGYFDQFLFYYNYYMTFFPDTWTEQPFEREEEPHAHFFNLYEQKLKSVFHLEIHKKSYRNIKELRTLLREELQKEHRILIPGDLCGLFYSNHYKGEPHTHYFIIKGYDAKRDLVYVLDNMHIEDGAKPVYRDFVIRMDDLVEMGQLYAKNWCSTGTIPSFWSIRNLDNLPTSATWLTALLDHRNQLERWHNGESTISFIEEEMLREIAEQQDTSRLTRLIPLTNYKSVYYDLIFNFMIKAGTDIEHIDGLKALSVTISEEWEQFRLSLFDRIADHVYEVNDLYSEVERIKVKEREFFESVRTLLIVVKLETRLTYEQISGHMGEWLEHNSNGAKIVHENESISMIHTIHSIDDTWITKDESAQWLIQPSYDQFSIEAKVINHNKYGPCFHSGLIVKFKDQSKMMFGNARRKLLAIFYPERTENYELFVRTDIQEMHYLRVEAQAGELSFLVKYEQGADWELLYKQSTVQPISSVGLFSKTWEPTEHRTQFSQLTFHEKG